MELVRRETQLDKPQVAAGLAELAQKGEIDTLHEIAGQAGAYQEYERRRDAKQQADYYGHIKVMAEANIGRWDIQMNWRRRPWVPLEFQGKELDPTLRSIWRLLGIALMTDQLENVIDRLATDPDESVSTSAVRNEFRITGMRRYVDAKPFRRRFLELNKTEGLSVRSIGKRMDMDPASVHHYFGPSAIRVPYPIARRLALELQMNPDDLRLLPTRSERVKRPKRKLRRRARQLVGGRLDESYSLVRKALQELDGATGQSDKWGTMEAWEHLYAAEDILGKALKRAK